MTLLHEIDRKNSVLPPTNKVDMAHAGHDVQITSWWGAMWTHTHGFTSTIQNKFREI
jgi:hypothetical protein